MDTKWRVNHITLKCDLDIKFAQPGHRFCTLAEKNIWVKSISIHLKGSGEMERTQIEG